MMSNIPTYRVLKNNDGYCILQDTNYQTQNISKVDIIDAIKRGKINVIDIMVQVADRSKGRFVDKMHVQQADLKSVCIPFRGLNGNNSLSPLSPDQQQLILFYGLSYINNMRAADKQIQCNMIQASGTIDADDLISLFKQNDKWTWQHYCSLDTACRDKVINLMYELAGVKKREVAKTHNKPNSVRAINDWLKRQGAGWVKVSSKQDSTYGRVYEITAPKRITDREISIHNCIIHLINVYNIPTDWNEPDVSDISQIFGG